MPTVYLVVMYIFVCPFYMQYNTDILKHSNFKYLIPQVCLYALHAHLAFGEHHLDLGGC